MIGGGVIGCAIAERLSLDGHQITLFERDQLASHASGAAAGELSPQSTASRAEEPALQSLALFPIRPTPHRIGLREISRRQVTQNHFRCPFDDC